MSSLDIIKQSVNNDNVNHCFRDACKAGNLDLAKWLIENFNNIDVHAYNEYAFIFCCNNGHLDVAKLLIE